MVIGFRKAIEITDKSQGVTGPFTVANPQSAPASGFLPTVPWAKKAGGPRNHSQQKDPGGQGAPVTPSSGAEDTAPSAQK